MLASEFRVYDWRQIAHRTLIINPNETKWAPFKCTRVCEMQSICCLTRHIAWPFFFVFVYSAEVKTIAQQLVTMKMENVGSMTIILCNLTRDNRAKSSSNIFLLIILPSPKTKHIKLRSESIKKTEIVAIAHRHKQCTSLELTIVFSLRKCLKTRVSYIVSSRPKNKIFMHKIVSRKYVRLIY